MTYYANAAGQAAVSVSGGAEPGSAVVAIDDATAEAAGNVSAAEIETAQKAPSSRPRPR